MSTKRSAFCFALLFLATVNSAAFAVEPFEIQQYEDTAFLPYRLNVLRQVPVKQNARPMNTLALLWRPRYDNSSKANYIGFNLPLLWEDQIVTIDVNSFPPNSLIRTAAVRMTPQRAVCYRDTLRDVDHVLVAGLHGDSAWLVKYNPETAVYMKRFLQTGEDATGDGIWESLIEMPLIQDYDFDGRTEIFVQVRPIRDAGYRTLYCLDLETLEPEWSLPVALGFQTGKDMCRLPDTANPGIIFATGGSRQGKVDEHYSELFHYCSVVDSGGRVLKNRIVQFCANGGALIADTDGKRFYLAHEFDPVHPSRIDSLIEAVENETISDGTFRLSVLDNSGAFLHTRVLDYAAHSLWFMPFRDSKKPRLYAYHTDRRVRVYDSTLNLLAESNQWEKNGGTEYRGPIKIEGRPGAQLFTDGIYSKDLEQLARFERPGRPEPITYDSSGAVTELLIGSGQYAQFVRIERRGWYQMLSVIYFRYRIYILVSLTALLVGLVVVNFYRVRTRRNLILISEQKVQLERAQEALQEAQAQLVAQEKFRQARDIAGGFAHEIRNALSPVRNALARLGRIRPEDFSEDQLARPRRLIDRSVKRAIDLTRRISEYSHLEKPRQGEAVNLKEVILNAVEQQRDILDDRGIRIVLPESCPGPVTGDRAQYEIVLSNLISNAADAVETVDRPRIEITCAENGNNVVVGVADNGVGVDAKDLDRVFTVFYSTKPDTGTGLGLAIVKKTVEVYGGSVAVESEPGRGSRFRVAFPAHNA